ncbi:MAG: dTMP kinase [Proteobacteria bacterium]|nr:dTMP kinase [Pseudomonadota bacterium]
MGRGVAVNGGRFITFEGGEGAGKSTQLARLCGVLHERGLEVVGTREPGGSPGAEAIRELLVRGETGRWDAVTETLLHCAARRDHFIQTIEPALARGAWVLCDRFADSTMAYQGHGHALGREAVEAVTGLVVGETKPDLTIILDLPVEAGLARAHERGHADRSAEDRYERMGVAFHVRLREGFLDIARREPERCVIVDAAMDVETVAEAVWRAAVERLNLA